MNKLSDWKWAIDYSKAIGQKDAEITPLFFTSRFKAQWHNKYNMPKGRVIKIYPIREKK